MAAQYAALAASAFSLVAPALKKNKKNAGGSVTSQHRVTSASSFGFSTGLATGLALGIIVVTQLQKRRIKERIRYSFFTWLNEDDNDDSQSNKSEISLPSQIDPSSLGEDSIIQMIANCNNSLTPNLSCSKITLRKDTRIASQKSKGVEIYYVLQGTADFIVNNEKETSVASAGSIVLNPWTVRSIANDTKDDLIMLRITDAGDEELQNNGNIFVEKVDREGKIKTITNGVKSSLQKLGDLAIRSRSEAPNAPGKS